MNAYVANFLMRGGLRSTYELQRVVGLEPGGIQPALRRLEEQGLVVRSKQERRRRRLIEVTDQGHQVLEQHWRGSLRSFADVESILRAAGIAMLMGAPGDASSYLNFMANEYDQKAPSEQTRLTIYQSASPVQWYGFMRALWQTRRHQSAAGVFRDIANELAILQQPSQ
jgi:DNA-binding MarR family transcriptional regulator